MAHTRSLSPSALPETMSALNELDAAAENVQRTFRGHAVRNELASVRACQEKKGGLCCLHVHMDGGLWQKANNLLKLKRAFEKDYLDSKRRRERDEALMRKGLSSERVKTELDTAQELSKLDFRQQGDRQFYTTEGLRQRRRCRTHPVLISEIERWWARFQYTDESSHCMTCDEYCMMNVGLQLALGNPKADDEELTRVSAEDFFEDGKGEFLLDHPSFFEALFELADIWTESTDPTVYAEFLHTAGLGVENALAKYGDRIAAIAQAAKERLLSNEFGRMRSFFERGLDGKMRDAFGRVIVQGADGRWYDENGNLLYDGDGKPVMYSGLNAQGGALTGSARDALDKDKATTMKTPYGLKIGEDGKMRDANGRVIVQGADGRWYDENGNLLYDESGNAVSNPVGLSVGDDGKMRDSFGRVLVKGADGRWYDENGNLLYDENGNLNGGPPGLMMDMDGQIRDANGRVLVQGADGRWYDENGNLLYDENGNPINGASGLAMGADGKMRDANGRVLVQGADGRWYDENGNLLYDENGNLINGLAMGADGKMRDASGRVLVQGADGRWYDENGNLLFDENESPIHGKGGYMGGKHRRKKGENARWKEVGDSKASNIQSKVEAPTDAYTESNGLYRDASGAWHVPGKVDQANYESRNLGPDRIKAPDKRREKHVFAEPVETKEIEKQTFSMSAAFASTRDAPEKEKGKEKNSSKDKKARRLKTKDSVEHGSYDAESPRAPVDRSNRAKVPPLKLTKESNDAIDKIMQMRAGAGARVDTDGDIGNFKPKKPDAPAPPAQSKSIRRRVISARGSNEAEKAPARKAQAMKRGGALSARPGVGSAAQLGGQGGANEAERAPARKVQALKRGGSLSARPGVGMTTTRDANAAQLGEEGIQHANRRRRGAADEGEHDAYEEYIPTKQYLEPFSKGPVERLNEDEEAADAREARMKAAERQNMESMAKHAEEVDTLISQLKDRTTRTTDSSVPVAQSARGARDSTLRQSNDARGSQTHRGDVPRGVQSARPAQNYTAEEKFKATREIPSMGIKNLDALDLGNISKHNNGGKSPKPRFETPYQRMQREKEEQALRKRAPHSAKLQRGASQKKSNNAVHLPPVNYKSGQSGTDVWKTASDAKEQKAKRREAVHAALSQAKKTTMLPPISKKPRTVGGALLPPSKARSKIRESQVKEIADKPAYTLEKKQQLYTLDMNLPMNAAAGNGRMKLNRDDAALSHQNRGDKTALVPSGALSSRRPRRNSKTTSPTPIPIGMDLTPRTTLPAMPARSGGGMLRKQESFRGTGVSRAVRPSKNSSSHIANMVLEAFSTRRRTARSSHSRRNTAQSRRGKRAAAVAVRKLLSRRGRRGSKKEHPQVLFVDDVAPGADRIGARPALELPPLC
ncbi:hypothetical protein NFJ02_38g96350 [Pycnococcus provasolii]